MYLDVASKDLKFILSIEFHIIGIFYKTMCLSVSLDQTDQHVNPQYEQQMWVSPLSCANPVTWLDIFIYFAGTYGCAGQQYLHTGFHHHHYFTTIKGHYREFIVSVPLLYDLIYLDLGVISIYYVVPVPVVYYGDFMITQVLIVSTFLLPIMTSL